MQTLPCSEAEVDTERSFLELPWTICLVASFTILVLGILQRDVFFGVQNAIENSVVGSARKGGQDDPLFKVTDRGAWPIDWAQLQTDSVER